MLYKKTRQNICSIQCKASLNLKIYRKKKKKKKSNTQKYPFSGHEFCTCINNNQIRVYHLCELKNNKRACVHRENCILSCLCKQRGQELRRQSVVEFSHTPSPPQKRKNTEQTTTKTLHRLESSTTTGSF